MARRGLLIGLLLLLWGTARSQEPNIPPGDPLFHWTGPQARLPFPGVCHTPQRVAQLEATGLAALSWLSGTWRSPEGMEEHWSAPEGGTMIGTSRGFENGVTTHLEFMLMRETPEGLRLTLTLPEKGVTMPFRLKSSETDEVTFEREDKPETMTYRRLADGQLEIVLDKPGGGFQLRFARQP